MKKFLIVILVVLFFLMLLGFFLFKLFSKSGNNPTTDQKPGTAFPTATDIGIQNQDPAEVQKVSTSFLNQIDNANEIKLGNVKIVEQYALQSWDDENKGGEALMKRDEVTHGWQLLNLGGGAWDIESLVSLGVPQDIAQRLLGGG